MKSWDSILLLYQSTVIIFSPWQSPSLSNCGTQPLLQRHCSLNPPGSWYPGISLFLKKCMCVTNQFLCHFLPLTILLYLAHSAHMSNSLLRVGSPHSTSRIPLLIQTILLPSYHHPAPPLKTTTPWYDVKTHHFPLAHSALPTLVSLQFLRETKSGFQTPQAHCTSGSLGTFPRPLASYHECLGPNIPSLDCSFPHHLVQNYSLVSLITMDLSRPTPNRLNLHLPQSLLGTLWRLSRHSCTL